MVTYKGSTTLLRPFTRFSYPLTLVRELSLPLDVIFKLSGFVFVNVDADPENYDPACLPPHILNAIEADSFWCLSRLLDGIQDNYISQQPGIHRSVKRMAELVKRIDGTSLT